MFYNEYIYYSYLLKSFEISRMEFFLFLVCPYVFLFVYYLFYFILFSIQFKHGKKQNSTSAKVIHKAILVFAISSCQMIAKKGNFFVMVYLDKTQFPKSTLKFITRET